MLFGQQGPTTSCQKRISIQARKEHWTNTFPKLFLLFGWIKKVLYCFSSIFLYYFPRLDADSNPILTCWTSGKTQQKSIQNQNLRKMYSVEKMFNIGSIARPTHSVDAKTKTKLLCNSSWDNKWDHNHWLEIGVRYWGDRPDKKLPRQNGIQRLLFSFTAR